MSVRYNDRFTLGTTIGILPGMDRLTDQSGGQTQGGRGARDRILRAASRLFYEEGINATGMERLTSVAHVSKRTFYQHFPGKDVVVEAYLGGLEGDRAPRREQALDERALPARERLLSVFADQDSELLRGCPFHNAAV